jgi:hypothetical protein
MPIYTEGAVIRRGQTLEEFETPFGDYISNKFQQALDSNPVNLIGDLSELNRANTGGTPVISDPFTGFQGEFDAPAEAPARLSAEDIATRAKEAGVKVDVPDDGLSEEAFNILVKRRQREAVQQDAIARSPTGSRSLLGFGAQLGASLLDPLNIGLAFVPVIGPARYSSMLAKAGSPIARAGVRGGVGAAEGAVGVAVFEPFAYGMHAQLQDDYSALDSLMNIGVGSVMGGGLHIGAGGIKDAYLGEWWKPSIPPAKLDDFDVNAPVLTETVKPTDTIAAQAAKSSADDVLPSSLNKIEPALPAARFDPNKAAGVASMVSNETREAALRTSVGQAMAGKQVDVEDLMRTDPLADAPVVQSKSSALLREWISRTLQPDALRGNNANMDVINRIERRAAGTDSGSPARKGDDVYDYELRDVRVSQLMPTQFGEDALNSSSRYTAESIRSAKSIEDIRAEDVLPILLSPDGRVLDGNHRFTAATLNEEQTIPALVPVRKGTGKVSNIEQYLNPTQTPKTPTDLASAVARQADPASVRVADVEAARAADERLATAPKSEALADAEASLALAMDDLTRRSLTVDNLPDINRELKVYDDAIASSEQLGLAARAAAICDLRG